jgi:hypothetical protein
VYDIKKEDVDKEIKAFDNTNNIEKKYKINFYFKRR